MEFVEVDKITLKEGREDASVRWTPCLYALKKII